MQRQIEAQEEELNHFREIKALENVDSNMLI